MERSEPVTIGVVLNVQRQNIDTAKKIIKLAVSRIPEKRNCGCATALQAAIVTDPELIPAEQRKKLNRLIGKYLSKGDS
jgi:5'-methylthioadenosine phosphorylase